jgi:hypothetical protein
MGCDIHICLEKKVKGIWVPVKIRNQYFDEELTDARPITYQVLRGSRDYELFNIISFNDARLERKHLNFAWEARGIIDEDISLELQEYLTNDSDLHTHSWLTIAEMKEAIDNPAIEIRSVRDVQTEVPRSACMLTEFYEDICKQISSLLPGTNPLDCKIVFAYDN